MDFDKETKQTIAARPPTKRRSVVKCLGVICGLITLTVIIAIIYSITSVTRKVIALERDPHKSLFYNGNVTDTASLSSTQVVRPLIDTSTKFDIAITIYARVPDNETSYASLYAAGHDWDESDYTAPETTMATLAHLPPVEIRHLPYEEILYSGIVLRGVSLLDRDLDTHVNFKLPLKRFYDRSMYSSDVRLGISLIPTVNSKLARLEDFTDWRPEDMDRMEKIDTSLMATMRLNPEGEDDTPSWEALEHLATSYSLIEFHEHPHPCGSNSSSASDESATDEEDDLYASVRLDEEADDNLLPSNKVPGKGKRRSVNEKLHPYLVTRSHFYVINETRLFDRKAYDMKHKALRQNSCGQTIIGGMASRFLCSGDYKANGHWQYRFVLHGPTEDSKKELAYAPWVGSLAHAAGPRDVRPLPVTRHKCPVGENETISADPEMLDVTYNIRFSALGAGRVHLLNNFVPPGRGAHNATSQSLTHDHSTWEVTSGLFGNTASGVHPWRRFIITFVNDISLVLAFGILSIAYWYSRSTSAGINRNGALIGAISLVAKSINGLVEIRKESGDHWIGFLVWCLISLLELYPVYLQVRLVSPFELQRDGRGWTIRRRHLSHRERASERKGTSIAWTVWAAIFCGLACLAYLPSRYGIWLVRPTLPPTEEDLATRYFVPTVARAGEILALLMQGRHNSLSGTFAGQFALTAGIGVLRQVLDLLYFSPTFIGRVDNRNGIHPAALVEMALEAWILYQAWTLPKVSQATVDEDTE